MKLSRQLPLALLTAAVVTAGLTGCESNHEKNVGEAMTRWDMVKSSIAIEMAEDQFNSGQLGLAEKTVKQAMAKDTKNPALWLMAGRIALENSQLETAYQRLAQSIKLAEELEGYTRKKKAEPYYYQGIIDQRWQRYESARERYSEAYEKDPENVSYFLARIEMSVQMGKLKEAAAELEEKASYFEQNPTVRALLAHIYRRLGDKQKAVLWFTQASMLAPEDMKLKEEVARSLVDVERYKDAVSVLAELLKKDYASGRLDLHRLQAQCYTETGKLREARDCYSKITSLDRTSLKDWVKLGEIAYRIGDMATALQAASRLINIAPDDHRGYLLAGMVWNKRDNLDRALNMFDRAAELAPKSKTPLIMRGIALQKNKRPAAAAEAYKQVLAIDPDDKRAKQLLTIVTKNLR